MNDQYELIKEFECHEKQKRIQGFPFLCCNLDKIIFENSDNIAEVTDSMFYMSNKIPEIVRKSGLLGDLEIIFLIPHGMVECL